MRIIIQRVKRASVVVNDKLVSEIGRGLCLLVGISRDDGDRDVEWCAKRVTTLRLFDDDKSAEGKGGGEPKRWALNVMESDLELLCVSQFTLYSVLKGAKPDFHQAMGGDRAQTMFESFVEQVRGAYKSERVQTGVFGAMMDVGLVNDGPVTITIESPSSYPPTKERKPQNAKGGANKQSNQNKNDKSNNQNKDVAAVDDDGSHGNGGKGADEGVVTAKMDDASVRDDKT